MPEKKKIKDIHPSDLDTLYYKQQIAKGKTQAPLFPPRGKIKDIHPSDLDTLYYKQQIPKPGGRPYYDPLGLGTRPKTKPPKTKEEDLDLQTTLIMSEFRSRAPRRATIVRPHDRREYVRSDGTPVSATHVREHTRQYPRSVTTSTSTAAEQIREELQDKIDDAHYEVYRRRIRTQLDKHPLFRNRFLKDGDIIWREGNIIDKKRIILIKSIDDPTQLDFPPVFRFTTPNNITYQYYTSGDGETVYGFRGDNTALYHGKTLFDILQFLENRPDIQIVWGDGLIPLKIMSPSLGLEVWLAPLQGEGKGEWVLADEIACPYCSHIISVHAKYCDSCNKPLISPMDHQDDYYDDEPSSEFEEDDDDDDDEPSSEFEDDDDDDDDDEDYDYTGTIEPIVSIDFLSTMYDIVLAEGYELSDIKKRIKEEDDTIWVMKDGATFKESDLELAVEESDQDNEDEIVNYAMRYLGIDPEKIEIDYSSGELLTRNKKMPIGYNMDDIMEQIYELRQVKELEFEEEIAAVVEEDEEE